MAAEATRAELVKDQEVLVWLEQSGPVSLLQWQLCYGSSKGPSLRTHNYIWQHLFIYLFYSSLRAGFNNQLYDRDLSPQRGLKLGEASETITLIYRRQLLDLWERYLISFSFLFFSSFKAKQNECLVLMACDGIKQAPSLLYLTPWRQTLTASHINQS